MPRDGRDPLGLGAAISMMMTERGLVAPAAGGNVLAQWETILTAVAPDLTGHVQAVKFDADTGRLDVIPDAPAYGTKVRWIAPQLVAAVNEKAPGANVRTLYVLPPAPRKAGPATAAADPVLLEPAPAAPSPQPAPSEGYRRAIEAHREAVSLSRVAPGPLPQKPENLTSPADTTHRALLPGRHSDLRGKARVSTRG
ncbi:hypothetical protein [Streptomyces sp. NPDC085529]|uniref:hypothetical protein n=1 Tax=Streptomyces sp. NPDC085529 TaxID=3365729 RepID=UPI0037D6CD6E